ncbi:MAG: hypothetical protein MUP31_08090 [Xanthomonadales bacterium]|nr:hypothetical protein [Xanthomonadales bacterium]
MKALTHKQDNLVIVYDADHIRHPGVHLFDPGYWEQQGSLAGKAAGRGHVLLLDTEFAPAVLKQYLRGGWAARISRDRYVFSGFERSRPLMEFKILEQLTAVGLPVPEPLADRIAIRRGDPVMWRNTGACIRRFHDFGLVHADLNARNILIGKGDSVHLVDFDRSRIRQSDSRACGANLRRLHRSLEKIWPDSFRGYLESCWVLLLEGYDAERAAA